jgi:predicted dehydrogenase
MVLPYPTRLPSLSAQSQSTQDRRSAACPVNVAILGVGRWGTHLLRNFVQHPQAKVVAVVDACPQRLKAVSQQFQLDQAILTCNGAEAMGCAGVEAVAIATPAATHYPLIRQALQAGLHVLAEKPLTLNPLDALELCCLAAQQQRQLVIDHTYLFHPAVSRGKAAVQQGKVGNLRYGYASRTHLGPVRSDVDALWDLAIHDIAIFNHWLGEVPIQVQAQGKVWLQASSEVPSFPQGLSDLVWLKLTYAGGFQAFIHLCWSNPDKQRRLCLVGSQGTLIFDELADAPLTLLQGELTQEQQRYVPSDPQRHVLSLETAEPLQQVCDHFLYCAQSNVTSNISSGWLGAELVQILVALTESLNQGGQPINLNLRPS